MASAPPIVGLLVAWPIWRTRQTILGNLAGTAVIFGVALGMMLRESVELDRLAQMCLDAGFTCTPNPSVFTRHALYAFIALVEVAILFTISLSIEARIRNRAYSPEWR
jgi:hypothetical protein